MFLTRTVVYELGQAIKFKSSIPDENLIMLVQVSKICLLFFKDTVTQISDFFLMNFSKDG